MPAIASLALVVFHANFDGPISLDIQVGNLKYVRYPNEIPGHILTGRRYSDNRITIESCQEYCRKNSFPLSGVEYGRECYYDRTITKPTTLDQGGCGMNYARNNKQICSGNARVFIFNATGFYQSRYMGSMGMRIEMCTKACQAAKCTYASLEYGRECWCSAQPWPDLQDTADPSCAMQCDMICGDRDAMSHGDTDMSPRFRNEMNGQKICRVTNTHMDTSGIRARKGRFLKVMRIHRNAHL
ncbi:WSC-domain-containing protein [Biscogniauxia marginata]|nr:WSC-domain-containing protein [Biscogniauxia marginata]